MNSLLERSDPRVADLFRRLGRVEKLLCEMDGPTRRTLNGHRFLSDGELSKILRVSRRTLQEYRTAGVIPYYLICGKILYSEAEISKCLEDGRRQSVEERRLL